MIVVRYAVCSSRDDRPVTRRVCDTREEAEKALERMRQLDFAHPEDAYWVAELGPECDAWRHLGLDVPARS